jgi:hypothetical protein
MNASKVQAWLETNGVAEVKRMPSTGDYRVVLTCAGYAGFGETVGAALEQARELNREFWEQAA